MKEDWEVVFEVKTTHQKMVRRLNWTKASVFIQASSLPIGILGQIWQSTTALSVCFCLFAIGATINAFCRVCELKEKKLISP